MSRSGTSSSWITFTSYAGERATIFGDSSHANVVNISGAHHVRVRDVTVTAAPNQWGAGILVGNSSYSVELLDNIATNNRSFGIKVSGSTGVLIRGNEIVKNETGIEVSYGGANVVIEDNDIHDNDRMVVNTVGGNEDRGANAVVLHKTNGPLTIRANRMWNNRATSYDYGYDGGAVEIYSSSGATIVDNTMWNNENVVETGSDGTIGCANNTFARNVAYAGARTGPTMGMILRCAQNMLVANNTFSELDRFVFDINASASSFGASVEGLTLRNNVAYSRADKIYSIDSAMPASVTINRNLAFNAGGGALAYVSGRGNTNSLATFRSWTGYELSGYQADPSFVDRPSADFTITTTSPAVDTGVYLSGITDGYLGQAPDLGRFERR